MSELSFILLGESDTAVVKLKRESDTSVIFYKDKVTQLSFS